MTDQDGSDSSALASIWRRAKQSIKPKRFPSASNKPTGATKTPSSDEGTTSQTAAEDKTQARRAQVRRAQIRHRQRKANYTRQLELEIAGIRESIADAAKDCQTLAADNESIKRRLRESDRRHLASQAAAPSGPRRAAESLFGGISLDGVAVHLGLDELFHAPVYQVSGPPSHYSAEGGDGLQHYAADHHGGSSSLPEMTPGQTQAAINFILALEHICWDHFGHNDFVSTSDDTRVESGHTMMATSLALQSAPDALFEAIREAGARPAAAAPPEPLPTDMSWQASGLTLQSLHGIALSLNPSDLEVTPVQAWFELSSLYPSSLLSRPELLDALKRECFGVVKCHHYGAVMERGAWESMVGRVLGPELAAGFV